MIFRLFANIKGKPIRAKSADRRALDLFSIQSPLPYSWIKAGQLAIGPMPRSLFHWQQLESDGFSYRFSCCYPNEHQFSPIPSHWKSTEVSLPDHRSQNPLTSSLLINALDQATSIISTDSGPLYLHCFAGQERSALMAVGLVCLLEKRDLFESLEYVKRCHKISRPLYHHLDLLETVIKHYQR